MKSIIKKIYPYIFSFICITVLYFLDLFLGLDLWINELKNITNIMLSSMLVISSVWISFYLIFININKDRYLIDSAKSNFLKKSKFLIYLIFLLVVWGSFLSIWGAGTVCFLAYNLSCIIFILALLIETYNSNKTLMLNTYINLYINKRIDDIRNDFSKNKDLTYTFDKLEKIYIESMSKCEFYICENILEKISRVFETIIKESNGLIIDYNENSNDIFSSYKDIINFNINITDISKNNDFLLKCSIKQQKSIIKQIINIKNIELFNEYIDEINEYLYAQLHEEQRNIVKQYYKMLTNICYYCMDFEVNSEYIQYILEECLYVTSSLNYLDKNINLEYYARLVSSVMVICLKKEKSDIYSICFNKLSTFTDHSSKISHNLDNIIMYYASIFNKLMEIKDNKKIEKYLTLIDNTSKHLVKDKRWLEFTFYALHRLKTEYNNIFTDKIHDINVSILIDSISYNPEQTFYMIPEYEDLIIDIKDNNEKVDDLINEFYLIINRAILKDSTSVFIIILQKLDECINKFERKDRDIQKRLFKIFFMTIDRVSQIENQRFFEIVYDILNDCIHELDKENNISDDLFKSIVNNIRGIAGSSYGKGENLTISLTNLLNSFIEEDNELRIVSAKERKLLLYKAIYNIGVGCVESNQEEALRNVSNRIGWLAIRCIDNSNREEAFYLIDRAYDLYIISSSMAISEKTLVFLLTLFTTIGTYCFKNIKFIEYRKHVINKLKKIDFIKIKTANLIRTRENDTWDKMFDDNTENLTRSFLKEVESLQNISK